MSRGRFYICGLGEICVDDVEFSYRQHLMQKIAECDETFFQANQSKQLAATRNDGTKEIIGERVPLREFIGLDLHFVEEHKEKPQIRIRSRSAEQINYLNAEFPELPIVQSSYKNLEVPDSVREKLLLSAGAVESLLSTIGWDSETESNTVEQAGLLIGNRYKDSSGFIWGKVTHIIPLKDTQSSRRGILMTADSFYEASSCDFPALKAMYPDVEIIGWYHTHTFSDQPVFSGTDYQTQSTTFSSNKSWFALVLNAQQRSFSSYFDRNAIMIKSFFECSEEIIDQWTFGINEQYYGSEQKAKIKKGVYAAEQEKAELEKKRKELDERERKLNKQLSNIRIQEQKIERERNRLTEERKTLDSQRRDLTSQRQNISRQQIELSKMERDLNSLQNMLKRIFPLAYEPNTGFLGLGRLFSSDPIRERRIPSSITYPTDCTLDVFYDSRKPNSMEGSIAAKEMVKYGQILNAIRHMIEALTLSYFDYCAVIDFIPPDQHFLLRSIVPYREIRNLQNGNAIIYALDRYDTIKITQVVNELNRYFLNFQLYVYIEEMQVIFKKS